MPHNAWFHSLHSLESDKPYKGIVLGKKALLHVLAFKWLLKRTPLVRNF